MSRLNPYITFKDNARTAMTFYQTVFGGKLTLTTFKEGGAPVEASEENNIMHAVLEADNGIVFMASDAPIHMEYKPGTNISLSLGGDNESELTEYWNKLSVGATIAQPLVKASWGDTFGMLTDQYGIFWMVNITGVQGK